MYLLSSSGPLTVTKGRRDSAASALVGVRVRDRVRVGVRVRVRVRVGVRVRVRVRVRVGVSERLGEEGLAAARGAVE